jgi:hypothetical protein
VRPDTWNSGRSTNVPRYWANVGLPRSAVRDSLRRRDCRTLPESIYNVAEQLAPEYGS